MKKFSTILILSFAVQFAFGQNGESERLIKNIKNYISEIDSLMECCKNCFAETHYHCDYGITYYYRRIYFVDSPDSTFCADEEQYIEYIYGRDFSLDDKIARQIIMFLRMGDWGDIMKGYYQNGKLAAIISRGLTLYINDGKIIYQKGGSEDVESLIQQYNRTFY